jgi:hypothetical protein
MAEPRLDDPLTIEQLRAALDYDPDTGIFTWCYRPDCPVQWNGKWAGKQAGSPSGGFITIRVSRKHYHAHRLAWAFAYGEWPTGYVDHANGDWRDNRISNLRIASKSQNAANSGVFAHNTSGLKGASWSKRYGKWVAQITYRGSNRFIGHFRTAEEAHAAYCDTARRLQGEFARFK